MPKAVFSRNRGLRAALGNGKVKQANKPHHGLTPRRCFGGRVRWSPAGRLAMRRRSSVFQRIARWCGEGHPPEKAESTAHAKQLLRPRLKGAPYVPNRRTPKTSRDPIGRSTSE